MGSSIEVIGEMVRFHGKQMIVIKERYTSGRTLDPTIDLEWTDAGGVKWYYRGISIYHEALRRIDTSKDRVLDTIVDYTKPSNDYGRLKEETERRFADPRPGDAFHEMFSFWMIVDDVLEDGRIACRTTGSGPDGPAWVKRMYSSADEFRRDYAYGGNYPGYTVIFYRNELESSKRNAAEGESSNISS